MPALSLPEFKVLLQAEQFGEVATVSRDAGYALGSHRHPFDACAYIVSGEITLVVAGVGRRYGTGDIFRLDACAEHEEYAGPQGVSYCVGRREASV